MIRNGRGRNPLASARQFAFEHGRATEKFIPAARLEGGIGGQREVKHPPIMVGALETIDDRAALQGGLAGAIPDIRMRDHAADGHGEVEFNHVARLPVAGEAGEAIREHIAQGHGPAVHRKPGRISAAVGEAIKIPRHRFVPRPAGDSQTNGRRRDNEALAL